MISLSFDSLDTNKSVPSDQFSHLRQSWLVSLSYPSRFTLKKFKNRTANRHGLSLLEVMISLAILAMSSAMLWQITNQATNNARDAQRLTQAQILAESKMSEILAGAFPLEPIEWRIDESGAVPGTWYFSLQTSTAERENMIGLRLSVSDDPQRTDGNPETFFIARYVIDPQLGLDSPQDPTLTDTASGSSSGASSSGSTGSSSGNSASGASGSGGSR